VNIPVISAGGWQSGAAISEAIDSDKFDAVSIARSLIASNDLVQQYARGLDLPDRPCTYCNKCLLNAPKNPLGCYEQSRFGGDYDRMVREILTVFEVPPGHWDGPPPPPPPSLS
jgi:2,4-dienoyl-CoA reductase (NADPH2)